MGGITYDGHISKPGITEVEVGSSTTNMLDLLFIMHVVSKCMYD